MMSLEDPARDCGIQNGMHDAQTLGEPISYLNLKDKNGVFMHVSRGCVSLALLVAGARRSRGAPQPSC